MNGDFMTGRIKVIDRRVAVFESWLSTQLESVSWDLEKGTKLELAKLGKLK